MIIPNILLVYKYMIIPNILIVYEYIIIPNILLVYEYMIIPNILIYFPGTSGCWRGSSSGKRSRHTRTNPDLFFSFYSKFIVQQ